LENRGGRSLVHITMQTQRFISPVIYGLGLVLLSFSCSTSNLDGPTVSEENANYPDIPENDGAVGISYLALGDSYTAGTSVNREESFPYQLKDRLAAELNTSVQTEVIAVSGWRTDDLLNALDGRETDTAYDLVSLLIGVNNQYQGFPFSKYEEEFPVLLQIALEMAENQADRVVVISIPDWAYTPFGQGFGRNKISAEIDAYNRYAEAISDDNNVTFVSITDITRQGLDNPELVAADNLHPSGAAYTQFVDRILPSILPALKN